MYSSDPVMSNESTASTFGLEVAGMKPKKTVTINDRANDFRRTNSDSPELLKNGHTSLSLPHQIIIFLFLDPFNTAKTNRANKHPSKKRSICKLISQISRLTLFPIICSTWYQCQ